MTAARKPTKYPPASVQRLLDKLGVEGVVNLEAKSVAELHAFAGRQKRRGKTHAKRAGKV